MRYSEGTFFIAQVYTKFHKKICIPIHIIDLQERIVDNNVSYMSPPFFYTSDFTVGEGGGGNVAL